MSVKQDLKSSWNWGIFKFQELLVVHKQWQKMFWFFRLGKATEVIKIPVYD